MASDGFEDDALLSPEYFFRLWVSQLDTHYCTNTTHHAIFFHNVGQMTIYDGRSYIANIDPMVYFPL